jgi:guanylate kinase
MAELRARLERRAEDQPEVIARRLAAGRTEIEHWAEYDYVIRNEDLDRSTRSVQAILASERLKRARQPGLAKFVSRLLAEPG